MIAALLQRVNSVVLLLAPHSAGAGEAARRARLLSVSVLAGLGTIGMVLVTLALVGQAGSALFQVAVGGGVLQVAGAVMLRRMWPHRVAHLTTLVGGALTIAGASWFTGGFVPTWLVWLSTLPMLALLVGDRLTCLITAALCLVLLVGFWQLALFGFTFPGTPVSSPDPTIVFAVLTAMTINLAMVGWLFDSGLRRSQQALASAVTSAEEANRTKTALLANVSHQVRTPLNGMIGMTQLLKDSPLDADQLLALEDLEGCGAQLVGFMDDILQASRLDAGLLDSPTEAFDLRGFTESLVDRVWPEAKARGLTVGVRVQPDVPSMLLGPRSCLEQALRALLHNAVKFTDAGAVVLQVDVAEFRGASASVRFRVSDTGVGIAPENLSYVFQPFAQDRGADGAGLGLTIAEGIVSLMGGALEVSSVLSEGTTFSVTVPMGVADRSPALPSVLSGPVAIHGTGPAREIVARIAADVGLSIGSEGPVLRLGSLTRVPVTPWTVSAAACNSAVGPRVLIAEADALCVRVVARTLERLGFDVDIVEDGPTAVLAAQSESYAAVLMDLGLPGMSGYEAAAAITRDSRVPIIGIGAEAGAAAERRCLDSGMVAFEPKPLSPDALGRLLAQFVTF
ncbi:MAG: signal transduction histidine kinase [Myxococcota bacterium]